MMETKIICGCIKHDLCEGDSDVPTPMNFEEVSKALQDGWELDSSFGSGKGTIALENAIVYHLIKLTPEERSKLFSESKPMTEFDEIRERLKNVADLILVVAEEVSKKIREEGYTYFHKDNIYAKSAWLIKLKDSQPQDQPFVTGESAEVLGKTVPVTSSNPKVE
jgi:hypothetical protein